MSKKTLEPLDKREASSRCTSRERNFGSCVYTSLIISYFHRLHVRKFIYIYEHSDILQIYAYNIYTIEFVSSTNSLPCINQTFRV